MCIGKPERGAKFHIDGHRGRGLLADLGEVVAEVGLQVEGQYMRRHAEDKLRQPGMHRMARRGWGKAIVPGSDRHGLVGGARSKRQEGALTQGLQRPPGGFKSTHMWYEHRRSDCSMLADMRIDFGATASCP